MLTSTPVVFRPLRQLHNRFRASSPPRKHAGAVQTCHYLFLVMREGVIVNAKRVRQRFWATLPGVDTTRDSHCGTRYALAFGSNVLSVISGCRISTVGSLSSWPVCSHPIRLQQYYPFDSSFIFSLLPLLSLNNFRRTVFTSFEPVSTTSLLLIVHSFIRSPIQLLHDVLPHCRHHRARRPLRSPFRTRADSYFCHFCCPGWRSWSGCYYCWRCCQ